jgi:hypothetical protein
MWIASATDMGALAIISGAAKVHEFRFQAYPDQMHSCLRIGKRCRAFRAKSNPQDIP